MIDIIIPAYNAHDNLYKALMSISLQVIKDKLKVYIIDDCSDEPYDYLKEDFNDLDITIKRLDKNIGPGVARNTGLEISNSEFVFFLDSDDMLINEFSLRTMYNNIEDHDLLIGVVETEQEDKTVTRNEYDDISLHGKLFRRSIIDKYTIKFPAEKRHEDVSFLQQYLCADPDIFLVDEYVYFYSFNEKSLTHKEDGYEEFLNFKAYISCNMFTVNNCIKNNLNKYCMEKIIMINLLYLYFEYEQNYNIDYYQELLEWVKPLAKVFLDYKEYYNEEDFIEGYVRNEEGYRLIPHTTWFDFIGDK